MTNPVLLDCLAHFHFGEGKVTVQNASIDGVPALVFTHSKFVGVPGEIAHPDEPSAKNPEVLSQSLVFTFTSEAQRDTVENALLGISK